MELLAGQLKAEKPCAGARQSGEPATAGLPHRSPTVDSRPCWLTAHIHACMTQNAIFFLDLKRDKFLGVSANEMSTLARLVHGWPIKSDSTDTHPLAAARDDVEAAETYIQQGLLTRDPKSGRSAQPVSLTEEQTLLSLGETQEYAGHIRPRHVLTFLIACSQAGWALQFRSLAYAVRSVQLQKARASSQQLNFNEEHCANLVMIFRRLRSLLFTTQDKCLFHALSLVNFLAMYHQFPKWVIGVQEAPFGAHSWVQHGQFVLDSSPESVCFYTPILAV